jgi:lipoprotein-anchoring transpeptidase ErfK/SrfK
MLSFRLDPRRHGSAGFTSASRLFAGAFLVALAFLGLSMAGQVAFDGRVMPGVMVGDRQVGGMALSAARQSIAKMAQSFAVQVNLEGKTYVANADQLGVTYQVAATADAAYKLDRQDWYLPMRRSAVPLKYSINANQLDVFVNALASDISHPPTDATIKISNGDVAIVDAISGMSIDKSALVKLITQDIQYPSKIALKPEVHVMPASLQADALTTAVTQTQKLINTPINLAYGSQTFTPSASTIGQWISFSKQQVGLQTTLTPSVDTSAVASYVASIAHKIDESPVAQEVFVANGTTKVIRNGSNGTTVDQSTLTNVLADAVTKNSALNFTVPTESIAYATESTNLTPLNYPQYIEVNLTTQHLFVWQDGQVIYDSPITSGATGAGFPTVTGLFHIYYKATNTHLIGYQYGPAYDYDVFVQYWMPFYQGYGLHDASWRNGNFGGQDYYYGGSHGCVNLPLATAAFLYGWSSVGTPVWVHN